MSIALLTAKKLGVDRDASLLFAMLSIESNLERWFSFGITIPNPVKQKILGKWKNVSGELFAMRKILEMYLEKKDRRKWCYENFIPYGKMYKAEQQFFKFLRIIRK